MTDFILPPWPAPPNVHACTTLRDCPTDFFTQLPFSPKYLKQTHGINVVCVDDLGDDIAEADASVSFTPGAICVVRTADCLPILICDKQGTQVAAIHAGWRGLAAGIITTTCSRLTVPMDQCLAWLGPAIGSKAFEVGSEVLDTFLAQGWQSEIIHQAFKTKPDTTNKWLCDLYFLARQALQQSGIVADNIYGGEFCTYSDPERFYSYRRSKDVGRMSTLIWLE
jgi:polyphenol oxidase